MSFSGNVSETWKRWIQRWTLYARASGVDVKDDPVKCAIFLHVIGEEGLEIYNTFQFTEEEADKLDPLKEKFESYCIPKTNVTFERYKLNTRTQHEGESIDQYVTELKHLAATCDYRELRDELIRDRIVLGLRDNAVRGRLLREADLTLGRAVEMCRADEASRQQIKSIETRPAAGVINEVKRSPGGRRGKPPFKPSTPRNAPHRHAKSVVQTCDACGYHQHTRSECPALNAYCKLCHKKGHFAKRCSTRRNVHEITSAVGVEPSEFFLGSVESKEHDEPPWHTSVEMNGTVVDFKIDCGADVTVISSETYRQLHERPKLKSANVSLDSPGGKLSCDGHFIAKILRKRKVTNVHCYVIPGLKENLLSRAAAVHLSLIARLDNVHTSDLYDLDVFGELGELKTRRVHIKLKSDAQPYSCSTSRRVPLPMLDKVAAELARMERLGVIVKVTEPTEWCSPIVVVPKSGGNIRLCVDLKRLNVAISRERYVLPTVEDVIHNLAGAEVFSSLDASCGYWQLGLHDDSSILTTFITPFGRYRFLRLPFGISSASEIFQREMSDILRDVPGVSVYQDDILVCGKNIAEHDQRLETVFNIIEKSGLKLNKAKCTLRQPGLEFLGHWISKDGVSVHRDKVKAIQEMKSPENIHQLRRFLGMVNYLGRFVKDLARFTKPLNELLCKDIVWVWGSVHEKAFAELKQMISSTPVLTFYDVKLPTVICADASGYGLGAVLMQVHDHQMMPVAYCSRTLTKAEMGYAAIEKECLACTWACEKFDRYLMGLEKIKLLTDHKPLIPLINSRDIDQTPIRCQRLLLRLMRFNIVAEHVPGKDQVIADTLSRQPLQCDQRLDSVDAVQSYVEGMLSTVPVLDSMLRRIRDATESDDAFQRVIAYTSGGWPRHISQADECLRDLYHVRSELSVVKGILVRARRIVVPQSLRSEILEKIHSGHQGITKCRARANETVWWPGLSKSIESLVARCAVCQTKRSSQSREPLKSTPMPDRPWQKVGADLFDFRGKTYIVMIDYYSRYTEVSHLSNTSSSAVIAKIKDVNARWGHPDILFTDNGPQFKSREFAAFTNDALINHVTSSPYFAQSNGEAERAVQVAKKQLAQDDPTKALMVYRATPIAATGYSPAELMMGRRMKTTVPILPELLQPNWPDYESAFNNDEATKRVYGHHYDRHHGAKQLPPLQPGDAVRLKRDDERRWSANGTVLARADAPRSFIVETSDGGVYRRNRKHLLKVPPEPPRTSETTDDHRDEPDDVETTPTLPGDEHPQDATEDVPSSPRRPGYVTRSGRAVRKPDRMDV